MREVEAFIEHGANGIFAPRGERAEGVGYAYVVEHCGSGRHVAAVGYAREHIIEHRRTQKTPQYGAFNVLFRENGYGNYACNSHDCGHHSAHRSRIVSHKFARAEHVERYEARQGAVVFDNDARLLHTYEGDEQAYAHGHRVAHRRGNGLENLLPESRYREKQENNAVQKYEYHRVGVSQPR